MATKICDLVGTYLPTADDAQGCLFVADGRSPLTYFNGNSECYVVNAIYPLDQYASTPMAIAGAVGGSMVDDGDYGVWMAYYDRRGGYWTKPGSFLYEYGIGAGNQSISVTNIRRASDEALIYPTDVVGATTGGWAIGGLDISDQFYQKSLFRNIDGSVGGTYPLEQLPFFPDDPNGALFDQKFSQSQVGPVVLDSDDNTMDARYVINVGAVPPPLFRFIRKVGNRLIGCYLPKYEIAACERVASSTVSLGSCALPYDFRVDISAIGSLPAGFNNYCWNLRLRIPSANGKTYNITTMFESGTYCYIGVEGYVGLANDTYAVEIIDQYPGEFFYTQHHSIAGGTFYWGDKITGSLNHEPYKLLPGDLPRGIGAAGRLGVIGGRYSSYYFVDNTTEVALSDWIGGTISGGTLSHNAYVNVDGVLFTLSEDGPARLQPVSIEDMQGGYHPRWIPADGIEGDRKCRYVFGSKDLAPIIDKNKPDYIHGCYDGNDTILWTFSTVGGDRDGDGQLMYKINSNTWSYIDGRQMLCLTTWDGNDGIYFAHGDGDGGIHIDFISQYEADHVYEATATDILNDLPEGIHVRSGITDDTVTFAGANFPTDGLRLQGIRLYGAEQTDDGNYIIDLDNFRYISSNTSAVITLSTDRDWVDTSHPPTYFAIGAMEAYTDTPAITGSVDEGAKIEEAELRLERLSTGNGTITIAAYDSNKDTDSDGSFIKGDTYEVPTIDNNESAIIKSSGGGRNGQTVNFRIRTSYPGTRVGVKTFKVTYTGEEYR